MKILVSGANGQLGRAVNRVFASRDADIINTEAPRLAEELGMEALDITDVDAVLACARALRPDVIINCAAYTAVDKQETDADLSYRINAVGPRNLAIAAEDTNARLVHISTDYVFDGKKSGAYTEFDAVCPASVYGRTKLAGEEFVRAHMHRYYILRTAWLYGEGHNFVRTMLRLSESHDTVSVVEDQFGTPTSALELAKAVATFAETENYGLFHATCEGECSWADFAEEIFRQGGKKTAVKRVSTEAYLAANPQSARRPLNSVLDNYMLRLTSDYRFADWRDAFAEYMGGEE